ncbi:MAG: hypothetical protein IJL05_00800 [Alphaproteobacteria bacterium]|nr:hypothetical protein [Alphaproteobacteria bacterium]
MKITIDLDDVIFNTRPIFERAFKQAGQVFKPHLYNNWDLRKCFDMSVVENLRKLFKDDYLYTMQVLDQRIPFVLNNLMNKSDLQILFVTERLLKQPFKTFKQIRNAGINCSWKQIYDKPGKKSDILSEIKSDLHFDDSPYVISGCIEKNIPVVMISNTNTHYNHYLRGHVKHCENLFSALINTGIYTQEKSK